MENVTVGWDPSNKRCDRCNVDIPFANDLKKLFPFEEFLCDACEKKRTIEQRDHVRQSWLAWASQNPLAAQDWSDGQE